MEAEGEDDDEDEDEEEEEEEEKPLRVPLLDDPLSKVIEEPGEEGSEFVITTPQRPLLCTGIR